MALRGYIKTVGGAKRMRWVRAGYDADNLSLPQSAVVFDSSGAGMYGVYLTGLYVGNPFPSSPTYIVTWPDLGYVPICTFLFRDPEWDSGRIRPFWSGIRPFFSGSERPHEMSVTRTGIILGVGAYAPLVGGGYDQRTQCQLWYAVHRMPAT